MFFDPAAYTDYNSLDDFESKYQEPTEPHSEAE